MLKKISTVRPSQQAGLKSLLNQLTSTTIGCTLNGLRWLSGLIKARNQSRHLAELCAAIRQLPQFSEHNVNSLKLKMALVTDEFSYTVLAPEATVIQLEARRYRRQIWQFKPDIVFIESAWFGYKRQWKGEMSIVGPKVQRLIKFCKLNNIPSVFWNKEDPTHFEHFLPLARLVDFVFTTEKSTIPRYQALLAHKRIHLLQFAAQPTLHNPLEEYPRQEGICFAGAYYPQHPERQVDLDAMLPIIQNYKPLSIYDRNFASACVYNPPFPAHYQQFVRGHVEFSQIAKAYKSYNYALNINTVKNSETMFSRRVFELMASNTLIISNFSQALKLSFGAIVFTSDNALLLEKYLQLVASQARIARQLKLLALRAVMQEHTYFDRLGTIKSAISGNSYLPLRPRVFILAKITAQQEFNSVYRLFKLQAYENKQLLLIVSPDLLIEDQPDLLCFNFISACLDELYFNLLDNDLIGLFSVKDYYAENYLTDLTLAVRYSTAVGYGKAAYYKASVDGCELVGHGQQYRPVGELKLRRGAAKLQQLARDTLEGCLEDVECASISGSNLLAIDEFSYCANGASGNEEQIRAQIIPADLAALLGQDYVG